MAGRIMELAIAIKGKVDQSIPSSLRQVANNMEELQKKAAQLNSTSKNTSAWIKQAQSVRQLGQELRQAQSAVRASAAALRQSGGSSQEAQQAYTQAQNRVRQLNSALEQERAKLHQTSAALQKAGFDTDNFAASQKRLQNAVIKNQTAIKANKVQKEKHETFEAAQNNRSQSGSRLADASANLQTGLDIGQILTEPLVEATEKAIQFESAMADVRKVVDFDTPQQFKEMSDDILKLSQTLPMTAEDIAKIVAAGGQSGIAREDLMSFAESAVKMGIAFDVTADQAGDMMAKWRTAFKMSQPEVVTLADKINYLGNTTAASAPLISDVVTRIGPLGEIGGVASGEIAALGASMVGTGVQSDVAATGIKNLILGMVAGEGATKSQAAAFEKLGMSAEDVAKRMQIDAKGAILDVMKALQALPKEEQAATLADLFGKESIGAISPLLSNLDALQDNFNKVADASQYAGSMETEYAARSATTENKIQLAKNAVTALSITIGNALLPVIGAIAETVAPIVQAFASWASKNQALVATLAGIAAAVAAVVISLLAISVAVSMVSYIAASMKVLQAALGGVKLGMLAASAAAKIMAAAQMALNAVMSANPLAIAVLAIMALVAALAYLWNTNETFRAAVINAWNQIKDAAMQVWGAIAPYVEAAWETIKSAVSAGVTFIQGIWAGIAPYASTAFNGLVTVISAAVSVIGTVIATIIKVIAAIIPVIAPILGAIATIIGTAFTVIFTVIQTIFSAISAVINAAMIIIKAIIVVNVMAIVAVWQLISSAAMAVWGIIGPYVIAVINGIVMAAQIAGTVITAIWNAILMVATTVWNTILAVAMTVWGTIGPYVMAVVSMIVAAVSTAGTVISAVWNAVYSAAASAWNAIVGVVQGVISSVVGIVKQGVAWVEEKWNRLKSIFSAPITAVVNFVKGGDSSAQSAAASAGASAEGGIFTKPYLTWVAEAGDPEVIVPINKTNRAMSLWQTAGRMLGILPEYSPDINQKAAKQAELQPLPVWQTEPAQIPQMTPAQFGQSIITAQSTVIATPPPTLIAPEPAMEMPAISPEINPAPVIETLAAEPEEPLTLLSPSTSNEVHLEFNPTITIQGNAGPDVAALIRQALQEQAQRFKRELPKMLQDIRANNRRLSYE